MELLKNWPEGPALLHAKDAQATKDIIIRSLQSKLGHSLPTVLLSFSNSSEVRRDPIMASAAIEAYVSAGYSLEPFEIIAGGPISEGERGFLFSALRRTEFPRNEVGLVRTILVCTLASRILEQGYGNQSQRDSFDDLMYLLRQEADQGSSPAIGILADSTLKAAARIIADGR